MQPHEKQQLEAFTPSARRRVAEHVKCNVSAVGSCVCTRWMLSIIIHDQRFLALKMHSKALQVDDCIAKFLYMRSMTGKVKQMKQEGKPMPKDFQQLEREFGRWSILAMHNAGYC